MTRADTLRAALTFAHGAVFGAILLLPGFLLAEDGVFAFWWMGGIATAQALLSFVPVRPPGAKAAPLRAALGFGVGLCAALGLGAWYFQGRIDWTSVEQGSLFMLAVICGFVMLVLMFVVMDRIRKAGERRDLRARGILQ